MENSLIINSLSCLVNGLVFLPIIVRAQVTTDGSLPTQVTTEDFTNFIVEAGQRSGNNLFHSFESFSVPTNGSVLFNNATDVQNIFSRVTGNSISEIDGLIRSLGEANLFLLNPNGIIFGNNAALDIGGSFIASTGESINFADGTKFSAVAPQNEPLLTVSIPIGLQYGSNPGDIEVLGTGQQIIINTDPLLLSPFIRTEATANLEVATGKTLALVGGNVTLEGSSLGANEGRIELGGVSSGVVGLEQTGSRWQLDYSEATVDRDLELRSLSAIDASGIVSQGISLTGRQITVSDGSIVLAQVKDAAPNTEIDLTATETIKISNTNTTSLLSSSINLITLEDNSTNLTIIAPQLILEQGGRVSLLQLGANPGGNLNLNIADEIVISGFSPFNNERVSSLGLFNRGNGRGGNVNIATNKLKIENGAFLGSITFLGTGSGGNVNINAKDLVEVTGEAPQISPDRLNFSASINASTLGPGNGGRISINTARLKVSDDGDLDSNTLASGNAGEIIINATESIAITSKSDTASTIRTASVSFQTELQEAFGLPPVASGDGGKIKIETPLLSAIGENAEVVVTTKGTGRAGNLEIDADSIFLGNGGNISASTTSGEGGNISLNVSDFLLLENQSFISAKAENKGNGGNIAIASNTITLTENSRIEASAIRGNGGQIKIDTLGFFQSSDSKIDASSSLGINGLVQIEELDTEPTLGLANMSQQVVDSARLVTLSCDLDTENRFIVTGRGGLPASTEAVLNGSPIWQDWRIPEQTTTSIEETESSLFEIQNRSQTNIVEAQEWKINQKGNIVLTANSNREADRRKFWLTPSPCSQESLSNKKIKLRTPNMRSSIL